MTPYRSRFRDWAAERTKEPREVCELALAHFNRGRMEAAYHRNYVLDRRGALTQQWAGLPLHGLTGRATGGFARPACGPSLRRRPAQLAPYEP